VTQKLGQIFKIWSVQNLDIIHSFRISGHLPAHIKNVTNKIGLEIDFENRRISNFNGLVTLTLDRVMRHTIIFIRSTLWSRPNSNNNNNNNNNTSVYGAVINMTQVISKVHRFI